MRLFRPTLLLAILLTGASADALAQGLGSPSRLAEIEGERSRACVAILERLEAVEAANARLRSRVAALERAREDALLAVEADDEPLIARLEAECILSALARRAVTLELDGEANYRPVNQLRTLDQLPLKVTA